MKPIDRFSYLKNNRVSQDTSSLVQCYLPIIGQEALSLYLYTCLLYTSEELHEPLTTRLEKGHIYRIVGENGVGKTRPVSYTHLNRSCCFWKWS